MNHEHNNTPMTVTNTAQMQQQQQYQQQQQQYHQQQQHAVVMATASSNGVTTTRQVLAPNPASASSQNELTLRSRRSSPGVNSPSDSSPFEEKAKKPHPIVIPPPTLRPQHVYAPVAPLGMLTLGVLSKKKKPKGGEEGEEGMGEDGGDFKKLLNGNGY